MSSPFDNEEIRKLNTQMGRAIVANLRPTMASINAAVINHLASSGAFDGIAETVNQLVFSAAQRQLDPKLVAQARATSAAGITQLNELIRESLDPAIVADFNALVRRARAREFLESLTTDEPEQAAGVEELPWEPAGGGSIEIREVAQARAWAVSILLAFLISLSFAKAYDQARDHETGATDVVALASMMVNDFAGGAAWWAIGVLGPQRGRDPESGG